MKIGFLHILTIIFVIAKLAKIIDWSWWVVLSPAILLVTLSSFILALCFLAAIGKALLE